MSSSGIKKKTIKFAFFNLCKERHGTGMVRMLQYSDAKALARDQLPKRDDSNHLFLAARHRSTKYDSNKWPFNIQIFNGQPLSRYQQLASAHRPRIEKLILPVS